MFPSCKMFVVFVLGIVAALGMRETVNTTINGSCAGNRSMEVNPRECCRSFLDVHRAIIECLPQPGSTSKPCIGQCILQSQRLRPIVSGLPASMTNVIAIGPKLVAHYDQCKAHLYDFLVGSTFEGDFRRVVCDERLSAFLECMVKSWFMDCLGFEDTNPQCVDLRDQVESSNCSISTFFVTAWNK